MPGTEGPHISESQLCNVCLCADPMSENVSSVPAKVDAHDEFKGDWVLFHPVYSPEELHAVTVSQIVDYELDINLLGRLGSKTRREDMAGQARVRLRLFYEVSTSPSYTTTRMPTICRRSFDIVSGYKHKPVPPNSTMSVEELRQKGYLMDDSQWLQVSCSQRTCPRILTNFFSVSSSWRVLLGFPEWSRPLCAI